VLLMVVFTRAILHNVTMVINDNSDNIEKFLLNNLRCRHFLAQI